MKKLTAILLSAVLMFSLTACNEQEEVVPVVAPVDEHITTTTTSTTTTTLPVTTTPELTTITSPPETEPLATEEAEPVATEPPVATTSPPPVTTTAPPTITTTDTTTTPPVTTTTSVVATQTSSHPFSNTVRPTSDEVFQWYIDQGANNWLAEIRTAVFLDLWDKNRHPRPTLNSGWTRYEFEHYNIDCYIDLPLGVDVVENIIDFPRIRVTSYDHWKPDFNPLVGRPNVFIIPDDMLWLEMTGDGGAEIKSRNYQRFMTLASGSEFFGYIEDAEIRQLEWITEHNVENGCFRTQTGGSRDAQHNCSCGLRLPSVNNMIRYYPIHYPIQVEHRSAYFSIIGVYANWQAGDPIDTSPLTSWQ